MYIPNKMTMADLNEMHGFVDSYNFGVLISANLEATHLPLFLDREAGGQGELLGHFARANPHWKALNGERVLAIFNGPHAYISPSWYADIPAVPTWNYAAVHVAGQLELVEDDNAVHDILNRMMARIDPQLLEKRDRVTNEIQQKMRAGIVGFKVAIEKIEGKQKLGQLRSVRDQRGVTAGLKKSPLPTDRALVDYMHQVGLGIGGN